MRLYLTLDEEDVKILGKTFELASKHINSEIERLDKILREFDIPEPNELTDAQTKLHNEYLNIKALKKHIENNCNF